jgi:hypothetical protein
MVELAAGRGVSVGFNSNATLLTPERSERLVAAGLDWLHVSLDGATAETYEGIRSGSSMERVRENLVALLAIRRRAGATRPEVRLVFVAMRRNLHELAGVVRLAAGWGVDRVWVQNLSHSFSDTDPAGDYRGTATSWRPSGCGPTRTARSPARSLGRDRWPTSWAWTFGCRGWRTARAGGPRASRAATGRGGRPTSPTTPACSPAAC